MNRSRRRQKYEYVVDLGSGSAADAVVRLVGESQRVLDVGAGPGSITRVLADDYGCEVSAVEIDPVAIEKLRTICERVYTCDLNEPGWSSELTGEPGFDVVVAADVLEHLYEPDVALIALKGLLAPDGSVVISLPHVGHNAVIACILQGDFDYQDVGLLDRTHIRFFGLTNVQKLLEDAGLSIVAAEFVVMKPEDTELAYHWRRLPAHFKKSLSLNPHGNVYQVVIKAKPEEEAGVSLRLLDLSLPATASMVQHLSAWRRMRRRAVSWMLSYLPPRSGARLRRSIGDFVHRHRP